jgi:excisionase family DNA binding protein
VSTTDTSGIYTRREAAGLLKINPRHLDSLIADGEIPAVRLGRAVRIPKPAIDKLLSTTTLVPPDNVAEYIEQVLAVAPPLTDEQRSRLAELLRPARNQAEVGPDARHTKVVR